MMVRWFDGAARQQCSEGENGDGDKQAGVGAVMMIGVRW